METVLSPQIRPLAVPTCFLVGREMLLCSAYLGLRQTRYDRRVLLHALLDNDKEEEGGGILHMQCICGKPSNKKTFNERRGRFFFWCFVAFTDFRSII